MPVSLGLRLNRKHHALVEIDEAPGLFLGPINALVRRAEVGGIVAKVVAINGFVTWRGADRQPLSFADLQNVQENPGAEREEATRCSPAPPRHSTNSAASRSTQMRLTSALFSRVRPAIPI